MVANEIDRLVNQPVRQVLARLAVRQRCIAVRREETRRATVRRAADIDVESLTERRMLRRHLPPRPGARCDVPLAEKRVRVTGLFQPLGDCNVFGANRRHHVRRLRPVVLRKKLPRQMRSHVHARWRLAGEHRRPCRRTNRRRRVGAGEAHPLTGESIDVRRLDEWVTLAGQVHPAEVVRHDEQNVRPPGCRPSRLAKRNQAKRNRERPPPHPVQV